MQVDLDALEAKRAKASAGPWSTSAGANPDDVYEAALLNAAPSLIAELREARTRIAELEESLSPFAEFPLGSYERSDSYQLTGRKDPDGKFVTINAGHIRRAARLLQTAKETP